MEAGDGASVLGRLGRRWSGNGGSGFPLRQRAVTRAQQDRVSDRSHRDSCLTPDLTFSARPSPYRGVIARAALMAYGSEEERLEVDDLFFLKTGFSS